MLVAAFASRRHWPRSAPALIGLGAGIAASLVLAGIHGLASITLRATS